MSRNCKSAYTLIELIVVMALFSSVLGISIGLLFQVFEFHDRWEERTVQDLRTERLVRQFRDDVHHMGWPTTSPDEKTLIRWTNDEKTVVYTLIDGAFPEKKLVFRKETGKNGQNREEQYDLPDNALVWFVNGEGTNKGLTVMSIWTMTPGSTLDDPAELDPFTRKIPERLVGKVDPKHPGIWRTIVAAQPK